jgi:hypothetical protein
MAIPMISIIGCLTIAKYNLPANLHCHTPFPFANGNSLLIADARSVGVFGRLDEESERLKRKHPLENLETSGSGLRAQAIQISLSVIILVLIFFGRG